MLSGDFRDFSSLTEGETWESPAMTITEAHVVLFAGLTSDFHPLHTNEEYAKSSMFGRRLAHGPLVFSVATGLFVNSDRLASVAFLGMDWSFKAPVFIGDTIRVFSKLVEKRMTSKGDHAIVKIERSILNQNDEVVEQGTTTSMLEVP